MISNRLSVVGISLAVAYGLLMVLVGGRLLTGFDLASIRWLQDAIPRVFDLPFSVLSLVGSFEITAAFVFLVLFFLSRPKTRVALFVLFLVIVVVEGLGKEFVVQPGPPHEYSRMIRLFTMPTGSVYTPFSFPSGHAARSAFITVVLFAWILQTRLASSTRWMLFLALVLAESIMLVSRVYLGEHWSSDVIAGTLLGVLCALPVFKNRLDPLKQRL